MLPAPLLRRTLRRLRRWVKLRSELQSRSTQVTGGARGAREALNGSEGVVLLDVRPQEEHEEDGVVAAFDGSVTVLNVPLFVRCEGPRACALDRERVPLRWLDAHPQPSAAIAAEGNAF